MRARLWTDAHSANDPSCILAELTNWGRGLRSQTQCHLTTSRPPTKRKHEPGLGCRAASNRPISGISTVYCDRIPGPAATRPDRTALTRGESFESPEGELYRHPSVKRERTCVAGAGLSLRPGSAGHTPGEKKRPAACH